MKLSRYLYLLSTHYSTYYYYYYYITIIILIQFVHERHALLDYQQITIYSDKCCRGRNESFSMNARNLEDVSDITSKYQMRSFSINSGMWALSPVTNFSEIGIFREAPEKRGDESENILGSCSSTARGIEDYTKYKSIRHIGNRFIHLPGISFYTKVNFFGEELYFDGTLLKLPTIYQFKSYGFTSKPSWTIFTDLNYTGNVTCLKSQDKPITAITHKHDHHGHKEAAVTRQDTENSTVYFVGSIRRHCPRPTDAKREKQLQPPKHIQQHVRHHINILTLHTKVNQNGLELMTDAIELRLPSTFHFKSYSFIGHRNWTIYNGLNFDGAQKCLFNPKSTSKAKLAKNNGNGSSGSHQSINFNVGSIRRGCETDPVKEVITPPPHPAITQGQTGGAASGPNRLTSYYYGDHQCTIFWMLNISLVTILSYIIN